MCLQPYARIHVEYQVDNSGKHTHAKKAMSRPPRRKCARAPPRRFTLCKRVAAVGRAFGFTVSSTSPNSGDGLSIKSNVIGDAIVQRFCADQFGPTPKFRCTVRGFESFCSSDAHTDLAYTGEIRKPKIIHVAISDKPQASRLVHRVPVLVFKHPMTVDECSRITEVCATARMWCGQDESDKGARVSLVSSFPQHDRVFLVPEKFDMRVDICALARNSNKNAQLPSAYHISTG